MNPEFYSVLVSGNNNVWFASLKEGKEKTSILFMWLWSSRFFSQQGVLVQLTTTISERLAYGIALLTDLVYKTAFK